MEEKQAELDNPVEGWNLSVKDVRKILSRKHRHRHSSNDDVIREGDYPDDDEEDEEEEKMGGAKGLSRSREERPTKEPIAEFPISSSRHTRSSTSSRDRRQPEHHHHERHHHHQHHHHHHHREHRSSSSSSATVSPVISVSPVMLAAAAASVDPASSRATIAPSPGKKALSTGTGTGPLPPVPTSAQKPPQPISQPSALPPPHLKTPVTMVISRDPRLAKRQQQQLLEKTQQSSSNQQQTDANANSKDSKSPSPATEASPQKSAEADEARMRERILLRQKYRIRKASDRRDSKDDSPEDVQQSPTATHPPPISQSSPTPPPPAPAPIKSCLVKGSSSSSTATMNTSSTGASMSPAVEPNAQPQPPQQVVEARPTSSEQGASLHPPPPRQQGFEGSVTGESVVQSTGEFELSPHKKAVFILDTKAAPVDVTSLPPLCSSEASRASTTHEVLPDSRVEPETGEVESMNTSSQVPLGTGSSVAQAEATPTTAEAESREEIQPSSDEDEKDDSSDSSDEGDRDEQEGGAKQAGSAPVGKCYMDQEGEEEVGVASEKEAKEEER